MVALIGFEASLQLRPLPCGLAATPAWNVQLHCDCVDQPAQKIPGILVQVARAHDFEVLCVERKADVLPFTDFVRQTIVQIPAQPSDQNPLFAQA